MEKRSKRKGKIADRRISIGDDMRKSITSHLGADDTKQGLNDDEKGGSIDQTQPEIVNPDGIIGAGKAFAIGDPMASLSARASINANYQKQLEADRQAAEYAEKQESSVFP